MSITITITITAETPSEVRGILSGLVGGDIPTPTLSPEQVETIKERAETPKAEPEIIPSARKPRKASKPADTVVQSEVVDIDQNGDPVLASDDEFAGKTDDELDQIIKAELIKLKEAKGEDAVYTLIKNEGYTQGRKEIVKSGKTADFVAKVRKEIG